MQLSELKARDVQLFLEIAQSTSIRELARARKETPGQISKSVRNLETKLGQKLLSRSAQGVAMTPYALEVLPVFQTLQKSFEVLGGLQTETENQTFISIATTSVLSSHFMPDVIGALEQAEPRTKVRLIDLAPQQFIPVALRNGFEVCLHLDDLDWPKTWTSVKVGFMEWKLCCRADHPISKRPSLEQVCKQRFVFPAYWTNDGLREGDDRFPISIRKRIRGSETATAQAAAALVERTDQIAFLPHLIVDPLVKHGTLREIRVPGLKKVHQPIYLTVKNDTIKQKRFMWMKDACLKLLSR